MATKTQLENIIAPAVAALGLELVSCEIHAQGRRLTVRVFIDSPQGVTVEDCTAVSRQISAILDVENPIHGQYDLEVSSPGLDRPLVTPAHYQRFLGKRARIKLRQPLDGRRNFAGELLAIEDDTVTIMVDGETFALVLSNIEKANLVPEF